MIAFAGTIKKQDKATKNLELSELAFRRLFEAAMDGILMLDAESGKITNANPFLIKILGFSLGELVGKELWQIGVFKDISESKAAFLELQNVGYIRYKDLPLQTKSGGKIAVEFVSNVYSVGSQKVIQCNIRDISDRKKVEELERARAKELEDLSLSQEKTKQAMLNVMEDLEAAKALIELEKAKDEAVLASIGEGLISVDNNRKIMMVNKAAEKLLGLKMKDLIGKEVTDLPMEDEEGNQLSLDKRPTQIALVTGNFVNSVYYFVRKDKTRFPIAINVTPIKLKGKIIGAIDVFRDITREKEIDRAKTEFVSLASHQLRTPLGISKWYLEAIEGAGYLDSLPPVAKEYFNEIYKSNERLLVLVRDLLNVSRIDQGKVRNSPKQVEIVKILNDVVKNMSVLAEKNNVKIQLILKKKNFPQLFIDPLRLQEALENILANAITYSVPPGKVEVIADIEKENLHISVTDFGIGISALDQKKLFVKFFRSEKAKVKNTEGSGLGLYVVKSYIDGWGGTISLESAEGKGSTFAIFLPLKQKE